MKIRNYNSKQQGDCDIERIIRLEEIQNRLDYAWHLNKNWVKIGIYILEETKGLWYRKDWETKRSCTKSTRLGLLNK